MTLTTTQYTEACSILNKATATVSQLLQAAEDRTTKLVDLKPQLASAVSDVPSINKYANDLHKMGFTSIRSWAQMIEKLTKVLSKLDQIEMELTSEMSKVINAEVKTQRMRGRDEWTFTLGQNVVVVTYGLLGCVSMYANGVLVNGDRPVTSDLVRDLMSKQYGETEQETKEPADKQEVARLNEEIEWMQGAGEKLWCSVKDKPEQETKDSLAILRSGLVTMATMNKRDALAHMDNLPELDGTKARLVDSLSGIHPTNKVGTHKRVMKAIEELDESHGVPVCQAVPECVTKQETTVSEDSALDTANPEPARDSAVVRTASECEHTTASEDTGILSLEELDEMDTATLNQYLATKEPSGKHKKERLHHVTHQLGEVVYWVAFSSVLGYYWSGFESDAHEFLKDEAEVYVSKQTSSGLVSIKELDRVDLLDTPTKPEPTDAELLLSMGFPYNLASSKQMQESVKRDMVTDIDIVHAEIKSNLMVMPWSTFEEMKDAALGSHYWLNCRLRGSVYGDVLAEALEDIEKQVRKDRLSKKLTKWKDMLNQCVQEGGLDVYRTETKS